MKVAVCSALKMENKYIEEWVRHYKKIGFDKIILFDNNDSDGEKAIDVPYVAEQVEEGYIDIYYHPDVRAMQTSEFTECYNLYQKDYDWIAFFDIDEYFEMKNFDDIHRYLALPQFDKFDCVQILWKMYDDNGIIEVKDGDYSVVNRFTHEFKQPQKSIAELAEQAKFYLKKSIIRGKTDKPVVFKGPNSHCPVPEDTYEGFTACNCDGSSTDPFVYRPNNIYADDAYLKHYTCKSLQEFIENKLVRLSGASLEVHEKARINILFYFIYNDLTYDKIVYLKENHPDLLDDLLNRINHQIHYTAK